ncbi:EF-hand domain-containing protein [Mesorhizobium japonicum]|nr:EF-hand domain-containing protein [Mesorhizobium japonicum]
MTFCFVPDDHEKGVRQIDKNNDGKIEKSELPKGHRFGHHRQSDDGSVQ